MTREEVVRLAKEAGIIPPLVLNDHWSAETFELERFAALIEQRAAQAEREACARVCEAAEERARAQLGGWPEKEAYLDGRANAAEECAAAIRARKEEP